MGELLYPYATGAAGKSKEKKKKSTEHKVDLPMLSGHFSTALNSFPSPGKGESLFPRVLPPYCLSLVLLSPCPLLTREKLSSSKSLPVTLSWAMAPVLLVYILFYSAAFVFSVSAAWNGKATVLHLPFSHTPRGLRSSVGLGKVP